MARLAGETLAPLAERYGVDVGPYGGLYRYLYLDVAPPSLQSPEIAEVDVAHQVQNATMDPGAEGETLPAWVHDLPPDRPVVYVSLGTVFNAKAPRRLRRRARRLCATRTSPPSSRSATTTTPPTFGAQPDHVHVERFIPQSLLLPYCDAVVNQGGTAILPILAHGLPLLVLPQGANQFHNAEACVAAGVGRRLLPGRGDRRRRAPRRPRPAPRRRPAGRRPPHPAGAGRDAGPRAGRRAARAAGRRAPAAILR